MEDDNFVLKAIDKDGNIKEFEILFSFTSVNDGNDYVVYTDNTYDEEEKLNIQYAMCEDSDFSQLKPVTSEAVIKEIEKMVDDYMKAVTE